MLEMANNREMRMIQREQIDDLKRLIEESSRLIERKRAELSRGEGDPAVLTVQIERAEGNLARAMQVAERDGILAQVVPEVADMIPGRNQASPQPVAEPPASPAATPTPSPSTVSPPNPTQVPPVNTPYRPTPIPRPSAIHRPTYPSSYASTTTHAATTSVSPNLATTGVFTRDMPYSPGLGTAMSDMANREIQLHGIRACPHEPGALYTLNRVVWVAIGVGLEAGAGLLSRMIQAGHTPFDLDAPFRSIYRKLFKPVE